MDQPQEARAFVARQSLAVLSHLVESRVSNGQPLLSLGSELNLN